MGDDDDPGGDASVWGPTSLALNNTTPSQSQSTTCKSCTLPFVPIDSRYKYCVDCKATMLSRPKVSATKRDSSAALYYLQDTNLPKQQKDDKDDNSPSNLTKLSEWTSIHSLI